MRSWLLRVYLGRDLGLGQRVSKATEPCFSHVTAPGTAVAGRKYKVSVTIVRVLKGDPPNQFSFYHFVPQGSNGLLPFANGTRLVFLKVDPINGYAPANPDFPSLPALRYFVIA